MTTFTQPYGRIRLSPRQARRPVAARRRSLTGAASAVFTSFAFREISLVVFGYFAYFLVRGRTEGSHAEAVANSHKAVDLEKGMGFFWEPSIQDRIVDHQWIVTLANWMYIYGHWPLIAIVSSWLLWKHRDAFTLFRSAFFISGAIGVAVFVLFPVAPPRLADIGVVDTVTLHSSAYRVLQPTAFTNQYAAVPSLHFGWDLLIGLALVTNARWLAVRIFGAIVPVLMFAAIVLTANHYIFDAVAGGAVALTGLATAHALRTWSDPAARRLRALVSVRTPQREPAM
ncbi:MAG: phosphatase PAP2 family protein [Chloroflexi bacterium]|nr:phosphatase PAP2 family protein [Chloroflexota bacterium]